MTLSIWYSRKNLSHSCANCQEIWRP